MRKQFPLAGFPCFLWIALQAIAVGNTLTPLQTKSFGSASNGISSSVVNGGPLNTGVSQSLNEFEKFDPTLGTLVNVLLTVDVNASYLIEITSDSIIQPNDPFSILPEQNLSNLIQASVIYRPTNGDGGFSITFDNANYSGTSIENENPLEHGGPENFQFSRSESESFGGFANGGENPSFGTIPVSPDDFNPADFIGTGNVVGLEFGFFTEINTAATLVNLDNATINLSILLAAGNATLQYEYIPASTSPPLTVTSYSKDGTNHTIHFTGTPGISDWKLKGSTNLTSFATDHTLGALLQEVSPGVYRFNAALPTLSAEPKYFFRVEKD